MGRATATPNHGHLSELCGQSASPTLSRRRINAPYPESEEIPCLTPAKSKATFQW
jgi:hypothetical protein